MLPHPTLSVRARNITAVDDGCKAWPRSVGQSTIIGPATEVLPLKV